MALFTFLTLACVLGIAFFSFCAGVDYGKWLKHEEDKERWVAEGRQQILKENLIRTDALHRSLSVDMERAFKDYGGVK